MCALAHGCALSPLSSVPYCVRRGYCPRARGPSLRRGSLPRASQWLCARGVSGDVLSGNACLPCSSCLSVFARGYIDVFPPVCAAVTAARACARCRAGPCRARCGLCV